VAFFCNWCTYTAADLAGVSRLKYSSNIRVIRLMCSGRVDPQFILDAFSRGADGVLIGGCHPNDCHYVEGNYKMLRRFQLLKRMLADLGIEDHRLRLEWISAAEGEKVKRVVNEMTTQIKALGPLGIPREIPRLGSGNDRTGASRGEIRGGGLLLRGSGRAERFESGGGSCLNRKWPFTGAPRAAGARKPWSIWRRISSAWSKRWISCSGRWRWISNTKTSNPCRISRLWPPC
jgi:F420-non-reducing hydrogenase iron-sulfur subunit